MFWLLLLLFMLPCQIMYSVWITLQVWHSKSSTCFNSITNPIGLEHWFEMEEALLQGFARVVQGCDETKHEHYRLGFASYRATAVKPLPHYEPHAETNDPCYCVATTNSSLCKTRGGLSETSPPLTTLTASSLQSTRTHTPALLQLGHTTREPDLQGHTGYSMLDSEPRWVCLANILATRSHLPTMALLSCLEQRDGPSRSRGSHFSLEQKPLDDILGCP